MFAHKAARIIGSIVAIGTAAGYFFFHRTTPLRFEWTIGIIIASSIIAFFITPYVTIVPYIWVRDKIRGAAISDLLWAAIGLMVGLVISALLAIPLANLPEIWGRVLPFVGALLFGYLGVMIAVMRKGDIAHLLQNALARRNRERDDDRDRDRPERTKERGESRDKERHVVAAPSQQLLLDTSTIIDGRIADIGQTGFITGTLTIPRFVLNELQRIADSSDAMRRNRGRRGLEILNRLQKDATVPIEIIDADIESIVEVDGKLVKMARNLHCPIITNDFNLNRVAELQGVKVLNINELANAIKPVLLPGEDMSIKIIQEGKEPGQGVGYLDDGTMIVVENGKQFMNTMIEITVTRVLQTVAGRMIFAHPKHSNNNSANTMSSPSSSSNKQR
ncbi:MAG: PIN domain nuclease [Chloroflexi bacterium]|nr:PIN domain nuclease [Ktedonobacteraceae bacterium]MBV9021714.1 PIN domain nuclease [Ktedonobacteraceae bacterium]MBV9707700.1 PIN domain nuclease [Chloroflexota bacterium]